MRLKILIWKLLYLNASGCTLRFVKMNMRISAGLLMALLMAVVLSGCARYKVVLNNGTVIHARSRPQHDKATDCWHFKDAQGKEVWIPSLRIREIER